ncbi:alpha/beta fold hydrolase [Variovorax terrae]|uniref:Alpha/beta hydrolase n=1 Tax=Variovorax terrae TaxID=2923278 RepID=A0A9X1VXN2_9BURK|nr:alpha/beta hydrolase [Variovorax terrae]MCJ0764039.1 alpha/beta hydrolase [Variovorax terrae]
MPKANIGGAQIHYEVVGQGPPLVLTTGQGTGPEARAQLIDGLARRHRVLSYDQRGTGRSERVPQGQSMEELAHDLLGLMDVAGFAQAHVMGLSTGTGKATALAAHHGDRVTRLVLGAPWTHGDDDLHVLQNLRKAAARTMPPEHYTHFNSLLIYPPEYRRQHAARFTQLAREAALQDAQGISQRLDAILAFDARPLYGRIACPTLVLGARDDLVMPIWFARDAARAIRGARLVELDGGGHLFPETRTDEFLGAVLPFLA